MFFLINHCYLYDDVSQRYFYSIFLGNLVSKHSKKKKKKRSDFKQERIIVRDSYSNDRKMLTCVTIA